MAWVWETETYEKASEAAEIGEKAYAARKAKERRRPRRRRGRPEGGHVHARRKKAEKAEAAAAAAAVAAAEAEAEAEKARLEAEKAEKARLADPAVQKEMAYQAQLQTSLRGVLEAALDGFLARAVALDSEPA